MTDKINYMGGNTLYEYMDYMRHNTIKEENASSMC